MKRSNLILSPLLLCAILGNTVKGNEVEQSLDQFNRLRFAIGGAIELVKSDKNRVNLEVIRGDSANLRIEVKDKTLWIGRETPNNWRFWRNWAPLAVHGTIYYEDQLNHLIASGSGRISTKDLKQPSLALEINGSGDIRITSMVLGEIESTIRGSGDIRIDEGELGIVRSYILGSGTIVIQDSSAAESHLIIKGSGDFQAESLMTSTTDIQILGSGDAAVYASDSLGISIKGSGNVNYWGEAKVSEDVAGSGDIMAH
ncbi:MAG: DUF2807 domain-containing protein [Gammaproteobacteria bacterium]|nr:DUF2807 domain-containing protein [Gammaproteobacteria bacterium]